MRSAGRQISMAAEEPGSAERRFSVTVSADLLESIEDRRQAAGLTRTAWIARMLAAAVEPERHQDEPQRTTTEPGAGALLIQAQVSSLNREIVARDEIIARQDREIGYLRGEVSKVVDRLTDGAGHVAAGDPAPPAVVDSHPPTPAGWLARLRSRFGRI